ncbi:hypothetical protein [Priestia megaterium]|uniref:hypothetical protein n=1 Tax=Priestia megaterium TaxID=1404 RepID=UPI000BFBE5B9|nr:hypothetical protein [Priestia megaterium]PGQ88361.1 hypothetical protein COA18_05370 [Priestia megaterium]
MPTYVHDCEQCQYLGTEDIVNHGKIDIYICEESKPFPTMVARFGNGGAEYTSIPIPVLLSADPSGFEPISNVLSDYYNNREVSENA